MPPTRTGTLPPVSAAQQFFIDLHNDPKVLPAFNDFLTIRWAFRITPGIRPRTLSHAFNKLVNRHDSLRMSFEQIGAQWRARVHPAHPDGLIVRDYGDVSPEEEERLIADISKQRMSVVSGGLFDMYLLKFGKRGDVVLIRVHHAVIDGYGIALLIEDFLKFALGMPVRGAAVTHADFMSARTAEFQKNQERIRSFWRAQKQQSVPDPEIGRKVRGLPSFSPRTLRQTGRRDEIFDAGFMAHIEQKARQHNVSLFSYLHAAYVETLCDMAGQDRVRISSVAGRRDPSLSNFIGADFSPFVIACARSGQPLADAAGTSAQLLQDAFAHLPDDSFFAGSRLGDASLPDPTSFPRFHIHTPIPSGRIKNSPFKKLFATAMSGKVALGPMSLERVNFPIEIDTVHELEVSLVPRAEAMSVSLFFDAEAFGPGEIGTFIDTLGATLGRG